MEENVVVRERLLALVREQPGASTRRLAEQVGLSESASAYHLRRIARTGSVTSHLAGRDRCWFASVCGLCPVLRRAIPVLARAPVAQIANALDATPRSVTELALATGLAPGTARWATQSLTRTFLVERSRGGRTSLREGAEVCLAKASAGQTCGLWGSCPMSVAWRASMRQRVEGDGEVTSLEGRRAKAE